MHRLCPAAAHPVTHGQRRVQEAGSGINSYPEEIRFQIEIPMFQDV